MHKNIPNSLLLLGEKCDQHGNPLPPGSPPFPLPTVDNPWDPFAGEVKFRLAELLFKKVEMSQPYIDDLLDIWCLDIRQRFDPAGSGPYDRHQELLNTIDSIRHGSAPWHCFETVVDEDLPPDVPEWQKASYQVWYRDPDTVISNILSNRDFADDFDPAPYVHLGKDGKRRWSDFMSGNFSFRHAVSF